MQYKKMRINSSKIHHKKYGQNFLYCNNHVKKIVCSLHLENGQHILEIGPGKGIISKAILLDNTDVKVTAIEVDNELCEYLNTNLKQYCDHGRFNIINDCFLKASVINNIDTIVSNTPFSLSKMIVVLILIKYSLVKTIVLGIQKEVADSIIRHDTAFGALIYTLCDTKQLFEIDNSNYRPRPNVKTTFIKLFLKRAGTEHIYNNEHINKLYNFLKILFACKRKKLSSAKIRQKITVSTQYYNLRPHQLQYNQIIELYHLQNYA